MRKIIAIVFILIGMFEALGFTLIGLDILGLIDTDSVLHTNVNLDHYSVNNAFTAFIFAFISFISACFGIYYYIETSLMEDYDSFQKKVN